MVDLEEHLKLLQTAAEQFDVVLDICVDVDMSYPSFFGVKRSSLHTVDDVVEFAKKTRKYGRLRLSAMMGYEAQIAGIDDSSLILQFLKWVSIPGVHKKRIRIVEALKSEGFVLQFVNAGGSGSLESSVTSCSEVTIGSGIFMPHLFDHIEGRPAVGFALRVTRNPQANVYVAQGGGYISSGADPKSPVICFPQGAGLTRNEGAGEVQTPIFFEGKMNIGDVVILRHAKAGELLEHFEEIYLLRNGQIQGKALTYRGQKVFL